MAAHPKKLNVAVIMAGGSGTRFWPLSTKRIPKQYVNLMGSKSLIQDTVKRTSKVFSTKNTFIVSTLSQKSLLKKQLPQIKNLVFEPEGKNTAPCLMLTAKRLLEDGYARNTVIGVFPADHTVSDLKAFEKVLLQGIDFATQVSGIVTLGIVPDSPHTGYGYIEKKETVAGFENIFHVNKFKEKPDLSTAQDYVSSGKYYWNAGIFIFRLDTIVQAFEEYVPEDWNKLLHAKSEAAIKKAYKSLTPAPFDIAILEKSPFVYVIPCQMGWSDIGSWDALATLKSQDKNFATEKSTFFLNSNSCYVESSSQKNIAVIGCENLIIVETKDSLLICQKEHDQLVRDAAKKFDK